MSCVRFDAKAAYPDLRWRECEYVCDVALHSLAYVLMCDV